MAPQLSSPATSCLTRQTEWRGLQQHPAVPCPAAKGSAEVLRTGPRVPADGSEVCPSAERHQPPGAAAGGQSAGCTCRRDHVLSQYPLESSSFSFSTLKRK